VAGAALSSTGAGVSRGGAVEHAASTPRIAAGRQRLPALRNFDNMWLILLEALGALAILVAIVWWTMFSGRKKGERLPPDEER
jgi:hypothetical protein